jgi:hypothetical protein
MLDVKAYIDDMEVVAQGVVHTLPSSSIRLDFSGLSLKVTFREAEKASDKALDTTFLDDKSMQLEVEVIREQTGALKQPYEITSNDTRSLFLMFRTNTAHNGQVEFAYTFYEKPVVPSAKKVESNGK